MKEVSSFQDALAASKFASVPENVVQTIEATNDTALLDNWLVQMIVADSLASFGF